MNINQRKLIMQKNLSPKPLKASLLSFMTFHIHSTPQNFFLEDKLFFKRLMLLSTKDHIFNTEKLLTQKKMKNLMNCVH